MRCRRRLKPQFAGSQRQALPPQPEVQAPQPRAPPSQAQPLAQVRPSQAQPLPLPQERFS
jgi:hypothetical protein